MYSKVKVVVVVVAPFVPRSSNKYELIAFWQ